MTTGKQPDEAQNIEAEIRNSRTFSLADLIGKEAGNLGESPVPKLLQVKHTVIGFVDAHLPDPEGASQVTLRDMVMADDVACGRHFDNPLQALMEILQGLLSDDVTLQEFVRQVDMKWGKLYGDLPFFERPGKAPHPDDPLYADVRANPTHDSSEGYCC
jgi:hypothetical protein